MLQAPDARPGLQTQAGHAADILLILCDVKLPDGHGVALLPRLKEKAPLAEIVLLTAYGTVPDSVRAIKAGAFDSSARATASWCRCKAPGFRS